MIHIADDFPSIRERVADLRAPSPSAPATDDRCPICYGLGWAWSALSCAYCICPECLNVGARPCPTP